MAKLNGVKTIDMVNGEITKVAYEGAEYAKVDDLVKSTEDILLAIENGLDRTKGEFYRVISVGSTVRWEDNTSVNAVGAEYIGDRFEVFRKISVDKPTLEQRVGALESDVAALKSSDSSLKGEKKSTSTFKIGDMIKVVANTASHGSKDKAGFHELGQGIVYVGAIGKVISVKGNYVKAKFAPKDVDQNYETLVKKLRFDEIELVAHVEETIEFEGGTYRKVEREAREGDVVISNAKSSSFVTNGKPYKVTSSDGDLILNGGTSLAIGLYNVGRTRETVDVYELIEQAKYVPQKGDIVVITGNRCDSRNAVGDIGKITKVKSYGINVEVPSKPNSPKVNGNLHPFDEVRKATPAEVEKYEQALMEIEKAHKDAEIAEKWAKIGRKPNEFKKGDAVFVTHPDGGKVYGIIHEDSCGHKIKVDFGKRYSICTEEKSELTLVAPVNSRFNA